MSINGKTVVFVGLFVVIVAAGAFSFYIYTNRDKPRGDNDAVSEKERALVVQKEEIESLRGGEGKRVYTEREIKDQKSSLEKLRNASR